MGTLKYYTDSCIFEPCEKFDFSVDGDPMIWVEEMAQVLEKKNGLAISANQIGLGKRIIVIKADPPLAMINPRIVDVSEEKILLDEGCLSYPGLIVKVRRPKSIRVRYQIPNGETVTEKYTGMTARVIQQQVELLDGITMLDSCSIVQREKAKKFLKRQQKHLKLPKVTGLII